MTSTAARLGLIALAVLVGAIAGLVVAIMGTTVDLLREILFHLQPSALLPARLTLNPELALLVPLLGGFLFGASTEIVRRWRPEREVDPIEANALHGGRMSLTGSMIVALQTIWSSGVGAAVGLDAGYTQAASGIASRIGGAFRLQRGDLCVLVGCGAAAGIAGGFGAPLVGAFYGFELVIGGYSPNSWAPVAIASVIGYMVAGGLSPAGIGVVPPERITFVSWELLIAAILGLLAALLGIILMRAVALCESLFARLALRPMWRNTVGGLCVGILAMVTPQPISSDHNALHIAALLDLSFGFVAVLFVLKMLAVIASLGAGFRGGMLFSSLLIGALGGHLLAAMLSITLPALNFDPNACAVIGMSALGASVIGGPMTMIFIALETTGDLWLTTLVIIAVTISAQVSREAFGYSFPTWRFHIHGKTMRNK
jgi:chloride channel protein, CIC family